MRDEGESTFFIGISVYAEKTEIALELNFRIILIVYFESIFVAH